MEQPASVVKMCIRALKNKTIADKKRLLCHGNQVIQADKYRLLESALKIISAICAPYFTVYFAECLFQTHSGHIK